MSSRLVVRWMRMEPVFGLGEEERGDDLVAVLLCAKPRPSVGGGKGRQPPRLTWVAQVPRIVGAWAAHSNPKP